MAGRKSVNLVDSNTKKGNMRLNVQELRLSSQTFRITQHVKGRQLVAYFVRRGNIDVILYRRTSESVKCYMLGGGTSSGSCSPASFPQRPEDQP